MWTVFNKTCSNWSSSKTINTYIEYPRIVMEYQLTIFIFVPRQQEEGSYLKALFASKLNGFFMLRLFRK